MPSGGLRSPAGGRPPTGKPNQVRVNISLPPEVLAALDTAVAGSNWTRSGLVSSVVAQALTKLGWADEKMLKST